MAICATTILQEEVDDAYRGRAFAFYDMMFNVTYAIGAVIFAAFMPPDGHSPAVVGVLAAGYAAAAAVYWLTARRGQACPGADGGTLDPRVRRPAQQGLNRALPAQLDPPRCAARA